MSRKTWNYDKYGVYRWKKSYASLWLPLNEVVYDFFDALKSRTRGYGSLDYEIKGYVPSNLVKLDILINKEQVDALSFIVHESRAYSRGKAMCEKLKNEYQDISLQYLYKQLLVTR